MKLGEWIGLLCILAIIYIIWSIRAILLLVFTGVVVAIALNSLVRRLQHTGVPRRFAVPTVLVTSFFVITLFFLGVVPPFVEQFSLLIDLIMQQNSRNMALINRYGKASLTSLFGIRYGGLYNPVTFHA